MQVILKSTDTHLNKKKQFVVDIYLTYQQNAIFFLISEGRTQPRYELPKQCGQTNETYRSRPNKARNQAKSMGLKGTAKYCTEAGLFDENYRKRQTTARNQT